MGEPKHARRYCDERAPSVTCLADDTHEAYALYGLGQGGLGQLVSPAVLKASVRALKAGHRQTETVHDAKMLPGTFIVDRDGTIRYTYYSTHAGDHPAIDDLIAAATSLQSA
jgi:peroxiredoxin